MNTRRKAKTENYTSLNKPVQGIIIKLNHRIDKYQITYI